MLNVPKIRAIYTKIQKQICYMIPEKWDKIYLYASVEESLDTIETGEMYFYYYPKGFLKKNPINVYEIPNRFNIEEKAYIELANNLYSTIKELREEFRKGEEKIWSNITVSIENLKFNIEYHYENLYSSPYSNEERHIIWKYKYLNFPKERLSKKHQTMLEKYLLEEKFENIEIKKDTQTIYQKNLHNVIEYDKEITIEKINQENIQEERKLDKYELYKKKQEQRKQVEEDTKKIEKQKDKKKNQILNF